MKHSIKHIVCIACMLTIISYESKAQLSASDFQDPAALTPIASEPAPELIVDAPLPEQLALGHVVIQYHTENLRIEPVYGEAALKVSPRIGHIHVTVDDATWHWADASNEPIILVGMKPGMHKVLIQMADPTHKVLQSDTLNFEVPASHPTNSSHH